MTTPFLGYTETIGNADLDAVATGIAQISTLPGAGRATTRLRDYLANNADYNAVDFGAHGGGVLDDSVFVAAAKTQAAVTGGLVYLPPNPGGYRYGGSVQPAPGRTYLGSIQGPVMSFNNRGDSCYHEFWRDGYTQRGSVGALGAFEMNVSFNMDYKTGIHRLYNEALAAHWLAFNENGVYLQHADATSADGDVWDACGRPYNWYSLADGQMYARGNVGLGDTPVAAARVYAKGGGNTGATRGLYVLNVDGDENFSTFDDGTLFNRKNVGFGIPALPAARVGVQSETADNSSYAMYLVDASDAEITFVRGDKLFKHNGDAVLGASTSQLGFYGHATTSCQVLPTGAGKTVDDVITKLQATGLFKQA